MYVVGEVSVPPGSLRHEVQTLPLWIPIVLGFQRHQVAKWAAIPLFAFWLFTVVLIWLFLRWWARWVNGLFFPTEVAMTIVIAIGTAVGLAACARWMTTRRPLVAVVTSAACLFVQLSAFRISLVTYIARR